jgi:hypothetical protein
MQVEVGEWVALITNLATTIGVIYAIYAGIRAERAETKRAVAAASRTEAAAAINQDYTPQLVDALREITRRADQPVPPVGVRWSLRNFENDLYILENIGSETAEQVQVTSHESLDLLLQTARPSEDLAPGDSITFIAAPSLATSDYTITVTWTEGTEQKSWRYPLPPKPAR